MVSLTSGVEIRSGPVEVTGRSRGQGTSCCEVFQCMAVLCSAVHCTAIWSGAVHGSEVKCSKVWCSVVY